MGAASVVTVATALLFAASSTANPQKDPSEKLILASTKFAANLYNELAKESVAKNIVFSPVSITTALFMVMLGANGNSSAEISNALHLSGMEPALLNSAFGELNGILFDKPEDNVTLRGANAVFYNENAKILEDYKNALAVFKAEMMQAKFSDPDVSAAAINEWISKKTEGLITDMISKESLDDSTSLLLSNVLYFSGEWHSGFNPIMTHERAFYVSHYRVIKTPFMHQRGRFKFGYVESLHIQIVELPYVGQEISMFIFLPDNFDLESIEKNLNHENLLKWQDDLHYETVDITLPRFKLESTFNLKSSLKNVGVKSIFDAGAADLSGISGDRSLFVDNILHKGVLEVQPLGGSVEAEREEVRRTPRSVVKMFYADRPFMLVVKNTKTDVIYVYGALKRPAGKEVSHDEL